MWSRIGDLDVQALLLLLSMESKGQGLSEVHGLDWVAREYGLFE